MKKILTKQFLIKKYLKNKKSAYQIAEETGYSSSTIWRHLKRHNIKIRSLFEAHADFSGNKNPFFRKQHNKQTRKKMKKNYADVSNEKNPMFGKRGVETGNYIDGRYSKTYYCIECNNKICYHTWRYGSKLCNSCKLKGSRSSTYIDGRSYEPYPQEFTSSLKLKIRKRDDFTCQECGMIEEEHIIVYGRVLDVHHVNYDKKNCREDNLISLCKQCNIRANFNRKYWEEHFKTKIKEKI